MKTALAGFVFLAVVGSAWPQSQPPAPAPEKPEKQAPPAQSQEAPAKRPMLNLRLDDAGKFGTQSDSSASSLPGLGGGAQQPARTVERSSPFPKDTNPTR